MMSSGFPNVFDVLNTSEIGLNDGVLKVVAVPRPVVVKSYVMYATRPVVPVFAT